MQYIRPEIYTLVIGAAFGNACMLLASGKKGKRAALPHATIKMAPPRLNRSFGRTTDLMLKANELEENTDTYVEFMSKFTGQELDKVAKDCGRDLCASLAGPRAACACALPCLIAACPRRAPRSCRRASTACVRVQVLHSAKGHRVWHHRPRGAAAGGRCYGRERLRGGAADDAVAAGALVGWSRGGCSQLMQWCSATAG